MRLIFLVPIVYLTLAIWGFWTKSHLLVVNFCDVGQGDAALVAVGGWQMLIDAGPGERVLACLDERMPVFDKKIELAVLTHPQQDHVEGFAHVLDYYEVAEVWMSAAVSRMAGYELLTDKIAASGARVREVFAGDEFEYGRLKVEVWWPDRGYFETNTRDWWLESGERRIEPKVDPNFIGTVLELKFGQFEVLMTADVDRVIQPEMMRLGWVSATNILKVPHHGSKTGIDAGWLEVVSPQLAVISSGKGNSYGHPAREILELLASRGIKTLRTDTQGTITVESDGERWWLGR